MRNVLVHGLGQNCSSWDKVREYLDFECACPNLPGLLNGEEVNYPNLYGGFVKYCESFSEPVNICGLSLGGILALNYAAEFPDRVKSLVLIGAQYKMPKGLLRFQNLLFRFMPKSAFDGTGFGKREFTELSRSMMNLNFSTDLERISCPTMIILGEKDKPNRKAATEMSKKIHNCELKIIPNCGHEVNIDAPDTLVSVLSNFWKRGNNAQLKGFYRV